MSVLVNTLEQTQPYGAWQQSLEGRMAVGSEDTVSDHAPWCGSMAAREMLRSPPLAGSDTYDTDPGRYSIGPSQVIPGNEE